VKSGKLWVLLLVLGLLSSACGKQRLVLPPRMVEPAPVAPAPGTTMTGV